MFEAIASHWSTLILVLSLAMAAVGIVHAIMTKEDVRAATGWVGVMLLSPFLGAIIYAIAGINRIRRATISAMRPVTGDAAAARGEGLGGGQPGESGTDDEDVLRHEDYLSKSPASYFFQNASRSCCDCWPLAIFMRLAIRRSPSISFGGY